MFSMNGVTIICDAEFILSTNVSCMNTSDMSFLANTPLLKPSLCRLPALHDVAVGTCTTTSYCPGLCSCSASVFFWVRCSLACFPWRCLWELCILIFFWAIHLEGDGGVHSTDSSTGGSSPATNMLFSTILTYQMRFPLIKCILTLALSCFVRGEAARHSNLPGRIWATTKSQDGYYRSEGLAHGPKKMGEQYWSKLSTAEDGTWQGELRGARITFIYLHQR